MKTKNVLNSIAISLFIIALSLNISISKSIDNKFSLSLKGLSKLAYADEEWWNPDDNYDLFLEEETIATVETCDIYSDPWLGTITETCTYDSHTINCIPDPNGTYCVPSFWLDNRRNCKTVGEL